LVTKEWSFYPGTGDKDDMAHNIINVPLAPLWREKEVSTATANGATLNVAGNVHNTRNRAKKEAAATSKRDVKGDGEGFASESDQSSKRISPVKSGAFNDVPTHFLFGSGRKAFRRAIRTRLLPSLRAFNPDLVLISAGFDACHGDVGNAKHMAGGKEKAGIDLDPEDYAWATRKVRSELNYGLVHSAFCFLFCFSLLIFFIHHTYFFIYAKTNLEDN
jgi:acetoin utilization deacetylase AcuC-like enzyme